MLALYFVSVLLIRSSQTAWTIGDNPLPRADDEHAVGAYDGTIFILGGYQERHTLVELDIATQSVTDHGKRAIMDAEIDGAAQYWSQQGPIVYIAHEDDASSICVFNIFDMRTREYITNWKDITFQTEVGNDGCLASSPLFLYITGGDPDGIDAVQVLSLTTHLWISNPLPPNMQQRRQHHSCIVHNDYLWAFGGQWTPIKNQNDELASNERIRTTGDITQNTWNYIDPLTVAIESHCAVAYQDIIYVIGGRDGDLTSFDFVHLVDANTGEVTVSPDRMQSVSQLGAPIIVDSTLYLFGGDPLTTEWQYCELDTTPPMPTTAVPTNQPTSAPSEIPTSAPIAAPSEIPTSAPVAAPSDQPTSVPSEHPTVAPFAVPSEMPTSVPSNQPTLVPSEHPTGAPVPSNQPTHVPSEIPTIGPNAVPTIHPSVAPIASPSNHPSFVPSKHPTDYNPQIHAPMPNEDATSQPTQDGFVGTSQSNYITTEASEESPLSDESEESLLLGRILSVVLWILLILAAVGMGKLCCRARARAKRDEQGMIEATNRQTNTGGTVSTTTADDTIDDWHTKQMNATNQMNGEQGQGMIEATNRQTNTGGTVSTTTADDTIDDWHTKQMNATNQMNGEQGQGMIEATNQQKNTAVSPATLTTAGGDAITTAGDDTITPAGDDTIHEWRAKQMNVTNQMNGEQGQGKGERGHGIELNDADADESDSEQLYEARRPSSAMAITPVNNTKGCGGSHVEEPLHEQTCVDCGLMRMGSLYNGLFYCNDCTAYYTVTPQ
eukprot:341361_1